MMVQHTQFNRRMQVVPPPPPTMYDPALWCSCHEDGRHPIIQLRKPRELEKADAVAVEAAA